MYRYKHMQGLHFPTPGLRWEPYFLAGRAGMTWAEGDEWSVELELAPGPHEFKLVVVGPDGAASEWEPGSNRQVVVRLVYTCNRPAKVFAGQVPIVQIQLPSNTMPSPGSLLQMPVMQVELPISTMPSPGSLMQRINEF